jgi:coenzyme F420-dependent glucose-6-phosphate dehydrogenase
MRIGFHASHEQFAPSKMLEYAIAAEQAGFDCAMSSDHFKPWSRSQGHSGYSWSWLGAAMARTKFPVGMICAAGYRYHPAVVAQAAATLEEMFPERFWFALGSGERVNEDVTGLPWPSKPERNEKMKECAGIIRALLNGERVTHRGSVTVVDAELYSRPTTPPPMLGAAVTESTAEFVGRWSDGLLTVASKPDQLKKVIDAFRRGGGEGKPIHLQVALNWAPTEEAALQGAFDHWRFVTLGGDIGWELRSPEDFETATRFVRPEDVRQSVLISADLSRHAAWLQEYAELGVDHVYLHQVDLQQLEFIEAFAAKVLPQVSGCRRS